MNDDDNRKSGSGKAAWVTPVAVVSVLALVALLYLAWKVLFVWNFKDSYCGSDVGLLKCVGRVLRGKDNDVLWIGMPQWLLVALVLVVVILVWNYRYKH